MLVDLMALGKISLVSEHKNSLAIQVRDLCKDGRTGTLSTTRSCRGGGGDYTYTLPQIKSPLPNDFLDGSCEIQSKYTTRTVLRNIARSFIITLRKQLQPET